MTNNSGEQAMENGEFASRRKHPRHTLRNAVKVIEQRSGETAGTVANLSLEGIMLVNSKPLHSDRIYQLCLSVAADVIPGFEGGEIHMGVDCLWHSPAESVNAATYWSGCQIIDISDSDFELVKRLIATVEE